MLIWCRIPNSNKTDKASMLDEAIEYLKQLQLQVQFAWTEEGGDGKDRRGREIQKRRRTAILHRFKIIYLGTSAGSWLTILFTSLMYLVVIKFHDKVALESLKLTFCYGKAKTQKGIKLLTS